MILYNLIMKQTKTLYTHKIIIGSITQRVETIKNIYSVIQTKTSQNDILMILSPNIFYHCNLH